MEWTKPKYKNSKVDLAGEVLILKKKGHIDTALDILNNWRAVHIFPLNTFQSRLRRVSKIVDKEALVVQRLKRTPSIIKKLKRGQTSTMKLSQMQDIGGCRSVLSNVDLTKKLCNEYYHIDKNTKGKHCDIKHHFKNKKD